MLHWFQVSSEGANTRIARITRMRFRIRCGMRNQGSFGGVGCEGWPLRLLLVKACYNSLKQLTGYSLIVIDNTNWREYVKLPGYIVEKWEKGRIPAAMFSDLLRVELLIK